MEFGVNKRYQLLLNELKEFGSIPTRRLSYRSRCKISGPQVIGVGILAAPCDANNDQSRYKAIEVLFAINSTEQWKIPLSVEQINNRICFAGILIIARQLNMQVIFLPCNNG